MDKINGKTRKVVAAVLMTAVAAVTGAASAHVMTVHAMDIPCPVAAVSRGCTVRKGSPGDDTGMTYYRDPTGTRWYRDDDDLAHVMGWDDTPET